VAVATENMIGAFEFQNVTCYSVQERNQDFAKGGAKNRKFL